MSSNRRLAAPLLFAGLALPAGAQELAWSGAAMLATDLTERGLAVWPGKPVAQAALSVSDQAAWSLSLAASAPLDHDQGPSAQWALRAAGYWPMHNDWQLQARLTSYAYTDGGGPAYDHSELALGGAWRDVLTLEASATRLHQGSQRPTWALDLGLRWPLGGGFSAAAGLGRAELLGWPRWCYTYADAGLDWQQGPWRASVRALATQGERVRALRGDAAEPHASASLGYMF
jgi:hypothetical protein